MDPIALGALALGGTLLAMAVIRGSGGASAGGSSGGGGGGSAVNAEPSAEVDTAIRSVARAWGIPLYFALANAAAESRFKPNAGLNTLAGGAPPNAIPERSVGLMQINVNPNTPTGRSRIQAIKLTLRQEGNPSPTDSDVLAWLRRPAENVGMWAGIVRQLEAKANGQGRTGDDKWLAIRVWLAATTLSPEGTEGRRRIALFKPTLAKWKLRTGGA